MTEKNMYYYPKNLRSKTQTLLWDFSSFLFLLGLLVAALFLFNMTNGNSLIVPIFFAILTIKFENVTLYEKMIQMMKFVFMPVKFFNSKKKKNSTQKLIGSQRIDSEGVYTTSSGRYIIWEVRPHNLCVLSSTEINILITKYTMLLSACPNLETMALDATSSIENNIIYLKERIKSENNIHIKRLLEEDLKSISSLASSTNTTRRYLFIMKLPRSINFGSKEVMKFRQYDKSMEDLGFNVTRLGKEEVKSVIANILDILTPVPDYDGLQYIDKEEPDRV